MVGENDVKGGIQGHWFFDHGNSTAHYALSVPDFRVENKMASALHSLRSLHSAPCDSFISSKFKLELKGRISKDMPWLKQNRMTLLRSSKQRVSRNAVKYGAISGLAVWSLNECTLKATNSVRKLFDHTA